MSQKKKAETVKQHQIELLDAQNLKPNPNNSRIHSKEQIDKIVASIKEFGFTNPVIVDEDNSILSGHGRWLAVRSMLLRKIPVIRLEGLTPQQKRAYLIADNKLSEASEWDTDLLKAELKALAGFDFDFGSMGFDDAEVQSLLDQISTQDDDTSGFEPTINPGVAGRDVTADDVERAGDALSNRTHAEDPETTEMMCPHCGGTFHV